MSEKTTRISKSFFIVFTIFLFIIPSVLLCLDFQKNIVLIALVIGFFVSLLWYLIFNVRPQKKFFMYLKRLSEGDVGGEMPKVSRFASVRPIQLELKKFVDFALNNLLNDLKMEILHTQDSSDVFLEEVQRAITNSSRISLGADYIDSRVENLDKLLGDSLQENSEIQKSIKNYTKRVENQTQSIENTSEVLENIERELKESIRNLGQNKRISKSMLTITEGCGVKIKQTLDAISKIADAINVANGTIEIVDNIAQETNLLAMNAAIEAAHAGESGRGFAVVATEIRKLAETTSKQVKTITDSLQSVIDIVDITTNLGNETGTAFSGISVQIDKFIKIFDSVIEDFTNLGKNNELIYNDFNKIKIMNGQVSSEMDVISKKIEENNTHLSQIQVCSEEIKNIVERNATESVQLNKGQVPVYKNVIENAKHLEQIRKYINGFRVKNVPINIWKSDKTELNLLIEALYNHLEWTVSMLKFIHGQDNSMRKQLTMGSTKFDKWFYNHACQKYGQHPAVAAIKSIQATMYEKAALIGKLTDAGKVQTATIEFSEILEQSRMLSEQLGYLKKYIIQESIKATEKQHDQKKQAVLNSEKKSELTKEEPENNLKKNTENSGQLFSFNELKVMEEPSKENQNSEVFEVESLANEENFDKIFSEIEELEEI